MAGLGKSRGSKSTSGSKSVGERIKSAREKGLGSSKSNKKDTAASGTKRNYGGAKPRRVGQGGTTTITESVDNLIGGAFTKKSQSRRGVRRLSREERAELIAKRAEGKAKLGERGSSRASRPGVLDKVREAQEAYRKAGKAGVKPTGGRRRRPEEEGDGTGRRTRPSDGGLRGRGPKRAGGGVVDTTPADRGRGPRPGGNVGSEGRGPKAGIGRGGKSGVGRGPKAGGNQIGNRGRQGPKRGQGPKRNIGQSGGNVGPGGAGPNPIGDFGTVYFM